MKVNAAKRSLKEAADAHLMPEQAQAVKDFLDSPGDQSKQAAVAGMKMSRDALKATAEHVANFADKATRGWREFSDKVKARADEQRRARSGQPGDVVDGEFREVPELPRLEGPKKSEDDSGVIAAIAQQVRPVIEEVRPDLYGPGADPEVQRTVDWVQHCRLYRTGQQSGGDGHKTVISPQNKKNKRTKCSHCSFSSVSEKKA
jgi:hypothetical protein